MSAHHPVIIISFKECKKIIHINSQGFRHTHRYTKRNFFFITTISKKPYFYVQNTVRNEFRRIFLSINIGL